LIRAPTVGFHGARATALSINPVGLPIPSVNSVLVRRGAAAGGSIDVCKSAGMLPVAATASVAQVTRGLRSVTHDLKPYGGASHTVSAVRVTAPATVCCLSSGRCAWQGKCDRSRKARLSQTWCSHRMGNSHVCLAG
jgi:hypothetical protein